MRKEIQLCDYGCGQEAKYPFKNGKWCCGSNVSKCSKIRKINSTLLKGENNPMFGKIFTCSEEHRKKISESLKGENNPNFGKTFSEEHRKKISESLKGENHPNFGKTHSKETKRKLRISAIKNVENRCGQCSPAYNPEACKIIDEYGKENDYNFQHAENGGEYNIEELGYWVDGYDKEKNVVIEIDEKHHFDIDGNLSEKDTQRQKEIEDFLKCEFIRLKI